MDIYYGKGISATGGLLDTAVKYELIEKRGAWYTRGEEKLGQGRENAITFLEEHPEYTLELENSLREKLFPGQKLKKTEERKGKGDSKSEKAEGVLL